VTPDAGRVRFRANISGTEKIPELTAGIATRLHPCSSARLSASTTADSSFVRSSPYLASPQISVSGKVSEKPYQRVKTCNGRGASIFSPSVS